MLPKKEIFVSQKGYCFCINEKNFDCLHGFIEIFFDAVPIKVPFKGICQYFDGKKFDFAFVTEWEPYFKQITSAISGSYLENEILINWILIANGFNKNSTKILNSGCDNLMKCDLNGTTKVHIPNHSNVPHPFYLDILNQYTDIPLVCDITSTQEDH